jgi:hypothetical protein
MRSAIVLPSAEMNSPGLHSRFTTHGVAGLRSLSHSDSGQAVGGRQSPGQYWPGIQGSHGSPALPGSQHSGPPPSLSMSPSIPGAPSGRSASGLPPSSVTSPSRCTLMISLRLKSVMALQALLAMHAIINNREGAFSRLIARLDRPYGEEIPGVTGTGNDQPSWAGIRACAAGEQLGHALLRKDSGGGASKLVLSASESRTSARLPTGHAAILLSRSPGCAACPPEHAYRGCKNT